MYVVHIIESVLVSSAGEYHFILITTLVLSTSDCTFAETSKISFPSSNSINVTPSDILVPDSASSNILPATNTELENLSGTQQKMTIGSTCVSTSVLSSVFSVISTHGTISSAQSRPNISFSSMIILSTIATPYDDAMLITMSSYNHSDVFFMEAKCTNHIVAFLGVSLILICIALAFVAVLCMYM